MSIKLANKRVSDFKDKYGDRALELACHAALPVAFNAELLHLLRINFFVDTSADLPFDAEFKLLLSPLCREIDEDLYEIEPEIRDILFQKFQSDNGARLRDVASLLKQYVDRYTPWNDRVELQQAQKLTALNILDRSKSREWFKVNESHIGAGDRDWYVAMYKDIDRQNEIIDSHPTKCILVLAANSGGTDRLNLAAEVNKIGARLQEGVKGKDYFVRFMEQSSAENLSKYLLEYKPVIVHFVGHGNSRGEMLLQNDRNEPQPIRPSAFAKLFSIAGKTVECVVLNSCFSLEMAEALQPHVRCTIGMSAKIDDESAGVFAGGFYRGLASGLGYYQAFELGCNEIERSNLPDADVPIFNSIDPTMYDSTPKRGTRGNGWATLYPVWYGTNRKLVDREGVNQGFGGDRDSQIHYGCCQVGVPKSHKIGSTGSVWWKRLLTMTDGRLKLDRSSLQLLDEINFFGSIKSALQDRPLDERSALVFIHGFNASFESAALQAAQIGFDLQVPGIMAFYSWPSLGKLSGYAADEATIGASEKYITEFLVNLAENGGIEKIHIIAHGMGNRGLLGAMQRILAQVDATNPSISFGQIFLAAPDVDADTFQDLAVAYQHLAERTTLYVSDKDKALKASRIINNFPRAGFFPPVRTYAGIDTVEVSNIDLTWLGHGYISDAREVLEDMYELLKNNTPPKDRFRLRSISTNTDRPYWQIGK